MPDVFYLQAANAAIPEDIRKEFQRDENGHVLFFSKPPISVQQPEHDYPALQLSTKVRAARIRRRRRLEEEKKKEIEAAEIGEKRVAKRQKQTHGATPQVDVEKVLIQWRDWIAQHQKGTDEIWKMNFGDKWEVAKQIDMKRLKVRQAEARAQGEVFQTKAPSATNLVEETRDILKPPRFYKDDVNPRY